MADRIVVDPVTRIEGHLRIEAKVENGVIVDAWASSTMYRGVEKILMGRDPRDAWYITQRFCGVCTTTHALASVRAVENAVGMKVPFNAEMIRNVIMAAQYAQDHIVHFYHLHALDWVDIVSALSADPKKTAALQQSISNWKYSSESYFKSVQDRLKAFVNTGKLGPFANAYWGHSAYKLSPEANLMATSHYLQALEVQKEIVKIQAILGSKNPHPQTYLTGGMAVPCDPNSQNALNADKIAWIKEYLNLAKEFVEQVYIPDVLTIAPSYLDWASIGDTARNYLCCGDFPESQRGFPHDLWFPGGVVKNGDLSKVYPLDFSKITEEATHAWYDTDEALHPWEGRTEARYSGPQAPYQFLNVDEKYTFVKAPRYEGEPMEVGPLARMIVGYASGQKEIVETVNFVLGKLGVGPEALFSTLGRIAARAIETLLIVSRGEKWLMMLADNINSGDYAIQDNAKWDPSTWPKSCKGVGWHEATRGALSHWIVIEDQKIKNYQAVVPTTWNAAPRDANGKRSPYEDALIGTPIADPDKPLEIIRTIHSYDPCLACAVHVYDEKDTLRSKVQIL
jgi:hydrogenase large subunit